MTTGDRALIWMMIAAVVALLAVAKLIEWSI